MLVPSRASEGGARAPARSVGALLRASVEARAARRLCVALSGFASKSAAAHKVSDLHIKGDCRLAEALDVRGIRSVVGREVLRTVDRRLDGTDFDFAASAQRESERAAVDAPGRLTQRHTSYPQ